MSGFSASVKQIVNVGGIQFEGASAVYQASSQIGHRPTAPAARAGTLTTRTNNTAGVVTLAADHGIVTGLVDVYWTGGVQYNVSATVAGNDVTLASGGGANLPAQGTAVLVAQVVEIDTDFDGALAIVFGLYSERRAHVLFLQEDGTPITPFELLAKVPRTWITGQGDNPFSEEAVGKARVSCGEAGGSAAVAIGLLYNAIA